MSQVEVNDTVVFKPSTEEVYPWEIPVFGATGSVRALTYNVGLNQQIGVYLPMCLVDFGMTNYTPIYVEDLKLVSKGIKDGKSEPISGSDHFN